MDKKPFYSEAFQDVGLVYWSDDYGDNWDQPLGFTEDGFAAFGDLMSGRYASEIEDAVIASLGLYSSEIEISFPNFYESHDEQENIPDWWFSDSEDCKIYPNYVPLGDGWINEGDEVLYNPGRAKVLVLDRSDLERAIRAERLKFEQANNLCVSCKKPKYSFDYCVICESDKLKHEIFSNARGLR